MPYWNVYASFLSVVYLKKGFPVTSVMDSCLNSFGTLVAPGALKTPKVGLVEKGKGQMCSISDNLFKSFLFCHWHSFFLHGLSCMSHTRARDWFYWQTW